MKKFFIIWCAIIAFALLMGVMACAEIYPQTFVINSINYEQDYMVLIDFNGNEWVYENVEGFNYGDIIAAIMEECGTPTIYDDEIVMVRYAGHINDWQ